MALHVDSLILYLTALTDDLTSSCFWELHLYDHIPQSSRQNTLTHTNMPKITIQLLLSLLSLTALAISLPLIDSSTTFAARRDGIAYKGIYICNKAVFKGDCRWHPVQPRDREGAGQCISFIQADGQGSIGPDRGLDVAIYLEKGCPEDSKVTSGIYPGWQDMSKYLGVDEHPILWFIARDL